MCRSQTNVQINFFCLMKAQLYVHPPWFWTLILQNDTLAEHRHSFRPTILLNIDFYSGRYSRCTPTLILTANLAECLPLFWPIISLNILHNTLAEHQPSFWQIIVLNIDLYSGQEPSWKSTFIMAKNLPECRPLFWPIIFPNINLYSRQYSRWTSTFILNDTLAEQ